MKTDRIIRFRTEAARGAATLRAKLLLLGWSLALPWSPALADYNANMDGVVTHVLVYSEGDQIYFRLDNQLTSHPACDASLFSIDASTPADRRKMMLARLLLAKATKEPMNVGYDATGNCSHGRIRVHRVG